MGDDYPVANVPFQDAQEFCRRLGDKDGRFYRLPSKAEWLAVAGLPGEALEPAWTELMASGILQHEVTSWHLKKLLDGPHPVGSLGSQTNQVCDLFGNVREWVVGDNGGESAGFAYNSYLLPADRLFLLPSPDTPAIAANTGFRCLLVDNQ
jgi:formylglycine-generating enzyme required for sulfatase activity